MVDIYESINELLEAKESFCLATILKKSGSAPREKGTKMIVKKDFSIKGTIGGGLPEAQTIKLCKDLFESKASIIKDFYLFNKEASSSDMVCGGEVKVLVEYIDAEEPQIVDIFKKEKELIGKREDFVFITEISKEEDKEYYFSNKWICTKSSFYGKESNEIQLVFTKIKENFKQLNMETMKVRENKYLIEPVHNCETVYIFGAGHVSQMLSKVAKTVGLRIVVLDDRSEFANRERFKEADDVIVIKSFNNIFDYVDIDNQSYVIIVTRGHAYDGVVLAQALETEAKYIGMIGSKTKVRHINDNLLKVGYTQEDLDRVYAPIGLDIFAETPEEIAVSITAELIKIRREYKDKSQ